LLLLAELLSFLLGLQLLPVWLLSLLLGPQLLPVWLVMLFLLGLLLLLLGLLMLLLLLWGRTSGTVLPKEAHGSWAKGGKGQGGSCSHSLLYVYSWSIIRQDTFTYSRLHIATLRPLILAFMAS
jgi:hypothetical protein